MSPSGDGFSVADGYCSCCPGEDNGAHNDNDRSIVVNCEHSRKSGGPSPSCLSSTSLLSLGSIPLKDWEKLRRILIASAKGFTIGAGIKGGLALFSILARLQRRKAPSSLRKEVAVTNNEAIVLAVKETLRYGIFLGTFAGTFVSMDELIVALGGHRSSGQRDGGLYWRGQLLALRYF